MSKAEALLILAAIVGVLWFLLRNSRPAEHRGTHSDPTTWPANPDWSLDEYMKDKFSA